MPDQEIPPNRPVSPQPATTSADVETLVELGVVEEQPQPEPPVEEEPPPDAA